jgi:GntR family transcriptional regulator, rspAB operon transcriptional repressor
MSLDALSPLDDELPLSRVIADRLAAAIIEGAIPPDTKLTEEELARRFKTSRTPVREALRLLELEALITFEPRKGVRVRRVTAEDTAELYLLRGHLGGLAARLAAENATPSDVERLRELQADLEGSLHSGDREHFARCVITYDDVLVTIAKNRLLGELLERLHRQSMRVTIMLTLPEPLFAQAAEVRSRMLEAIATHEPDGAEQAMRDLNQMTWNALAERGLPRANPDTPAQVEQIAAHRSGEESAERAR